MNWTIWGTHPHYNLLEGAVSGLAPYYDVVEEGVRTFLDLDPKIFRLVMNFIRLTVLAVFVHFV